VKIYFVKLQGKQSLY